MKAFAVLHPGEQAALHDIPQPKDDGIVVHVRYAGVNPIDWKMLERGGDRPLPYVVGQDFAGVAERVHNGTDIAVGDRVFGISWSHGAYAEETVVSSRAAEPVAKIPEGVTDAQAAALPTAGLTALAAVEMLRVGSGSTFAVFGATGGVGSYAVQIACGRGARVIAVVRGDVDDARALGAQEVVDVASGGDPVETIRRSHPKGIDAILDVVNASAATHREAAVLAPGGRIVSTIHALDEAWFHSAGFEATNIDFSETPQASPEGLAQLARLVADGTIKVRIAEVDPLDKAADVLAKSKAGMIHGKAVLQIDG